MDFLKELLNMKLLWFLAGLIIFIAEFINPGVILIFFGIGAWLVCVIIFFIDLSINVQLFIFLLASVISLVFLRKFFKKYRYLASVGLKPGLENGKYREVIPEQIGAIAMAIIIGIGIQWVIDEKAFDYEKVAKIAQDMILLYMETKD